MSGSNTDTDTESECVFDADDLDISDSLRESYDIEGWECSRPVWEKASGNLCVWHTSDGQTQQKPPAELGKEVGDGDLHGSAAIGVNLTGIDFQAGVDFIDADLSEANLRRTDLSEADLGDANLSEANLRRADLSEADLGDANLSEAELYYADLSGADLGDANLSEAKLCFADLSRVDLSDVDLSKADLSNADLSGADLEDADLSGADLEDADLFETTLSDVVLSEATLNNVALSGATLNNVDISETTLNVRYTRRNKILNKLWESYDSFKRALSVKRVLSAYYDTIKIIASAVVGAIFALAIRAGFNLKFVEVIFTLLAVGLAVICSFESQRLDETGNFTNKRYSFYFSFFIVLLVTILIAVWLNVVGIDSGS